MSVRTSCIKQHNKKLDGIVHQDPPPPVQCAVRRPSSLRTNQQRAMYVVCVGVSKVERAAAVVRRPSSVVSRRVALAVVFGSPCRRVARRRVAASGGVPLCLVSGVWHVQSAAVGCLMFALDVW